jgi:hypothetical protein
MSQAYRTSTTADPSKPFLFLRCSLGVHTRLRRRRRQCTSPRIIRQLNMNVRNRCSDTVIALRSGTMRRSVSVDEEIMDSYITAVSCDGSSRVSSDQRQFQLHVTQTKCVHSLLHDYLREKRETLFDQMTFFFLFLNNEVRSCQGSLVPSSFHSLTKFNLVFCTHAACAGHHGNVTRCYSWLVKG